MEEYKKRTLFLLIRSPKRLYHELNFRFTIVLQIGGLLRLSTSHNVALDILMPSRLLCARETRPDMPDAVGKNLKEILGSLYLPGVETQRGKDMYEKRWCSEDVEE